MVRGHSQKREEVASRRRLACCAAPGYICDMEPDELKDALRQGPVRIKMNNGDTFDVPHSEFISVGDYTAALLIRENGQARHRIVTLVNISDVELLPSETQA